MERLPEALRGVAEALDELVLRAQGWTGRRIIAARNLILDIFHPYEESELDRAFLKFHYQNDGCSDPYALLAPHLRIKRQDVD